MYDNSTKKIKFLVFGISCFKKKGQIMTNNHPKKIKMTMILTEGKRIVCPGVIFLR